MLPSEAFHPKSKHAHLGQTLVIGVALPRKLCQAPCEHLHVLLLLLRCRYQGGALGERDQAVASAQRQPQLPKRLS